MSNAINHWYDEGHEEIGLLACEDCIDTHLCRCGMCFTSACGVDEDYPAHVVFVEASQIPQLLRDAQARPFPIRKQSEAMRHLEKVLSPVVLTSLLDRVFEDKDAILRRMLSDKDAMQSRGVRIPIIHLFDGA